MGLNYLFIAQALVIYSVYATIFVYGTWVRTPLRYRKDFWGDGDLMDSSAFNGLLGACPAMVITIVLLERIGGIL